MRGDRIPSRAALAATQIGLLIPCRPVSFNRGVLDRYLDRQTQPCPRTFAAPNVMPDAAATNRKIVRGIMLGLMGWGLILALGDYLANHNLRRTLVIMACVVLFIGFWLAMLFFGRPGHSADEPD